MQFYPVFYNVAALWLDMFLSTLFPDTLSPCSFLNARVIPGVSVITYIIKHTFIFYFPLLFQPSAFLGYIYMYITETANIGSGVAE
jgi:hypothetical protein